jgi:hypothetical protein
MARTFRGKTRFKYRITLVPKSELSQPKAHDADTQRWKCKAIYNVKMRLTIQAEKASRRAKWNWYQFYSVRGYGAPSTKEFVCPYSGMIAKTIGQQEAVSIRRYWATCASKTREVIEWLELLPPHQYTRELNHFLLRLIFIPACQREIQEYIAKNPFNKLKPWQELLSTTSNTLQLVGHSLHQPKQITESLSAESRYAQIAR